MKKTMKRQIAITFIGLVIVILFVSLLINRRFLGTYYIANKQSGLEEVYRELNAAVKNGRLTEESTIQRLNRKVEMGNFSFVVLLKNGAQLTATPNEQKTKELTIQLTGYLLDKNQQNGTLMKESESYQIRSSRDVRNGEEYLEMWGVLSSGENFIIRSPLDSINQSVLLSNRFLTYIVLVVALLSSVVVWIFAKRFADPIMELAVLSAKMADLDFDAKYTSGGQNEIGILGQNFNVMSEKLEQTISELKTANYELQKDIEKKEKIDQMRTEFIGNVSHELKTPIALIQGYAEGLKEGVSDDAESRAFYCDVIMDEANKMNRMVKNLLTLNQMEFGDEEIVFSRFDIVELIQGVIQYNEILIRQKEADVRFAYTEPVYVWADAFKAEQVFVNYFSNALQHLDGEHIIDVRLEEQADKGTVKISVFNTGKPIPQEDVDRVWEKFYKVDKAHTREYGGNGIGLSIVKAIMEAFHCDYGVKNYENGVLFWFELEAR